METEGEWLAVGQHNWALWHHPESSSVAFVHFGRRDPGSVVDEVHFIRLDPNWRLQANDLRLLALGRVQSMAADPDIEPLLDGTSTTEHHPVLDPAQVSAEEALARCAQLPERSRTSSLVLSIPPKGQRDRYFYEILDAVYRRAASQSSHPAKDIADANDVPVSTVHSWLKAMRKVQADEQQQQAAVGLLMLKQLLSQLPPDQPVGSLTFEEETLEDGSVRVVMRNEPPNDG